MIDEHKPVHAISVDVVMLGLNEKAQLAAGRTGSA
jgi:hypothetical protein